MNQEIQTFFSWVDDTLSVADQLIKDDQMGFGREIGLTICFIVLEIMVISLYGKQPDFDQYQDNKSDAKTNLYILTKKRIGNLIHNLGVKDRDIIKFIKQFDTENNGTYFKDWKYRLKFIFRTGEIVDCEDYITDYELFNWTRNHLVHTGRNIGTDWLDSGLCDSNRKILFPIQEVQSEDDINRVDHSNISLLPETTLQLMRDLATNYKNFCENEGIDPRANINPEEIRLLEIRS